MRDLGGLILGEKGGSEVGPLGASVSKSSTEGKEAARGIYGRGRATGQVTSKKEPTKGERT